MGRTPETTVVWAEGAAILLAGRRTAALQEHIFAARWDPSSDRFTLHARIPIPFSGTSAQLVAGGSVVDYESGLFQSYVVYEQNSCLSIGCLDLEDERFELVAELPLPTLSDKLRVQDCWLANGPTIFATWKGKLLVATSKCSGPLNPVSGFPSGTETIRLKGSNGEYAMEASLLQVRRKNQKETVKLHFCGDMGGDFRLEAILSVGRVEHGQSEANSKSLEWLHFSPGETAFGTGSSQSVQETNKEFRLALAEQMPKELQAEMVSCIQMVPAGPSLLNAQYDMLIGTKDHRLLRCRLDQAIDTVHLDGVATELHFAVVAGGQGVIVAVISDSHAVALCADSLTKLEEWSRVSQVVVGDFTLSGYDQIILLRGSIDFLGDCELFTPLSDDRLEVMAVHGFSKFSCTGTPRGSQQHLKEVKAIDDHRASALDAIVRALQNRIEAGEAELKAAEWERESKTQLFRVSSQALQGMVAAHAVDKPFKRVVDTEQEKPFEPDDFRIVQTTKVEHRVCGGAWCITVDVAIVPTRSSAILHHVSLLLSSLNGSIYGTSSVLENLAHRDGIRSLVVCIPIPNLSLLPGHIFHIFLSAAGLFTGDRQSTLATCKEKVDLGCPNRFTQWLCTSRVVHPTSLRPLHAKDAITLIETIGEHRQFAVAADSAEAILQLPESMRSALSMWDFGDDEQGESSGRFSLMSTTGFGVAQAAVNCIGKHALVTLKTSNSRLMAMLHQSLKLLIQQHRLRLLPRSCCPDALEKVKALANALAEELGAPLEQEERHTDESASELRTLQMATDKRCAEALLVVTQCTDSL